MSLDGTSLDILMSAMDEDWGVVAQATSFQNLLGGGCMDLLTLPHHPLSQ